MSHGDKNDELLPAELVIACHQCAGKYWIKAENNWWWFEHLYRCPHCKAAFKVVEHAAPSAIGAIDKERKRELASELARHCMGESNPEVLDFVFKNWRAIVEALHD